MSVRVKICGITSPEQALMAQQAGADALGLVVYSKSSRYVDIQRAAEIRAVIGPETLAVVLLVNADESPEFCQQFDVPFIRAIRMREGLDIDAEVAAYRADAGFLFDAWSDDQYGGTGHQFDWSRLPGSRDYPLILAGGLTPDNVASAVSLVNPDMVDVSGGVESSPGVKDQHKVTDFIRNAKQTQP